ncbi:protein FAM228B-like isoform X2 [Babylonia areolata]|uniref:protein FAM228B-like isoform X2 n=1 Tax=Babylonia areolata TaxID=304850 RepID=UPI003FD03319
MSSLLCVKTPSGTVQVHNEKRAEHLTIDDNDNIRTTFMPRPKSKKSGSAKRPMSTPNTGTQTGGLTLDDAPFLKHLSQNSASWLSKKQMQDIQDVSDYLEHKDMLDLRKRELLHKNWNSRVYEPIRHKIIGAMNNGDWNDKDRRRRELHRQYLEHVNKKGHVFLDTMDKGEYYGQALNHHRPAPITVQTESLQDPLLAQERERSREDQVILRCATGHLYSHADISQVRLPPLPLVPLGRHGTDSVGWLEMPLGNIESTPRRASRLRMKGNCTATQIDFPGWSKLQFDSRVLDQEMQLQKKRMFEEKPPYGIPARQFEKAPFSSETTCKEQNALCAVNT